MSRHRSRQNNLDSNDTKTLLSVAFSISSTHVTYMKIRKAYKFRLKTNLEIEALFRQYSGCCRFVWNKMLSLNLHRLENRLPLIGYYESTWFLTLWKQSEEYDFLRLAPAQALQQSLKNLDRAFRDAFDKKQPLKRLPRHKKKGRHKIHSGIPRVLSWKATGYSCQRSAGYAFIVVERLKGLLKTSLYLNVADIGIFQSMWK